VSCSLVFICENVLGFVNVNHGLGSLFRILRSGVIAIRMELSGLHLVGFLNLFLSGVLRYSKDFVVTLVFLGLLEFGLGFFKLLVYVVTSRVYLLSLREISHSLIVVLEV